VRLSRNLKELRANPVGRYELRAGQLRLFFEIDDENEVVIVLAIGRKKGNRLRLVDEEVEL
jgi:mRNA-degrading endonuclease RelE of RelBE toxin-antitoxin system